MGVLCRFATGVGCAIALSVSAVSCENQDHLPWTKKKAILEEFKSAKEFTAASQISDSFSVKPITAMKTRSSVPDESEAQRKRQKTGQESNKSPINSDFSLSAPRENAHKQLLAIKKSALDKEFLLRTNLIQGDQAPKFHNLKSRVVAFVKKSGRVFLMEAGKGHSYYNALPQKLILTDFQIEKETDESIYFDFNQGMSRLYTLEDWYAQDFSGSNPAPFEKQFHALELYNSYIEDMTINQEDGYLFVRQVAQIRDENSYIPMETRYYFEPYRPSDSFQARTSQRHKKDYGFFEVNPTISDETGKHRTYASKFNLDKPIQFAISSNTPEEYKEVIKEGVEYWNKVLGTGALTVVDAPAGMTAPQYKFNMIQWIDWDDADGAYADAQMDPRTGEILNVQIYLSSVFAINGKQKARAALARLFEKATFDQETAQPFDFIEKALALSADDKTAWKGTSLAELENHLDSVFAPKTQKNQKRFGLKGFSHDIRCNYSPASSFSTAISHLIASDVDDAAFDKISKDYLRGVTAHEVGHTLGFRHNFAGSLAANYEIGERDSIFAEYAKTGATRDGLNFSSSVMDYNPFEESAMIGDQIKNQSEAFSYDKMAVEILYKGAKFEDFDHPPLFCTDSHLGTYVDCNVWDTGRSPLAYSKYHTARNAKTLPHRLIEYFIVRSKSVFADQEPLPFTHILSSNHYWAHEILKPRMRALETLNDQTRSLALDRSHVYVTGGNIHEIDQEFAHWIHSDLASVAQGEWKDILDHTSGDYTQWVIEKFESLVNSPVYRNGVGPAGAYEFTDAEIEEMLGAVKLFMKGMDLALAEINLLQLHSLQEISNAKVNEEGAELDDSFVRYLQSSVREFLFETKKDPDARNGNKILSSTVKAITKAKVSSTDVQDLKKKILVLTILTKGKDGPLQFSVIDKDPSKTYSPKDLEEMASSLISNLMEKVASELNLDPILAMISPEAGAESVTEAAQSERFTEKKEEVAEAIMKSLNLEGNINDLVGHIQKTLHLLGANTSNPANDEGASATKNKQVSFGIISAKSSEKAPKANARMFAGSDSDTTEPSGDVEMSDYSASSSELGDSDIATEDAESIDETQDKYTLEVGCLLSFEVELPEFKYEPEHRLFAAQLLDGDRGKSLAYAMEGRNKLAGDFSSSTVAQLRGLKAKHRPIAKQPKLSAAWIKENEKISALLSGASILSSLLGID